MNAKAIGFFAILLIGVIGTAGYFGFNTTKPTPPAVEAPSTVTAAVCDVQQSVSAPGRLVNTHTASIEMPVAGRLAEILVQPGDQVSQGQLLARLADLESYAAQTSQAELAVMQAQQALDDLHRKAQARQAQLNVDLLDARQSVEKAQAKRAALTQPRTQGTTLERAEGELLMAQEAYQQAQQNYQAVSNLSITNPDRMTALEALAAAKQQVEHSQANLNWYQGKPQDAELARADADVELAKANAAAAQAAIIRLVNGVDPIEEAKAKDQLAQAQYKLAQARQVEQSGAILAPFGGVVLDVSALTGENMPAGGVILTLSDPKALLVKANITQEDYQLIARGQEVELYFDARADLTITGTVQSIIPKRLDGSSPLYNIYIALSEAPEGLIDGMTADSAITIAKKSGVLCLPRAVVRASGTNTVSIQVWDGLQTTPRQVEIGLRGDTSVEIKAGLKAGEQVVTK